MITMWPPKSSPVFSAMALWISYYVLVFQVLCFTKKSCPLSTSHIEENIYRHWDTVFSIVFVTEHCPLSLLQEKLWLTSAVGIKSLVDCSFIFFFHWHCPKLIKQKIKTLGYMLRNSFIKISYFLPFLSFSLIQITTVIL